MRILGIDYGLKRVGLALGDTDTGLAVPLRVVRWETRAHLFEDVLKAFDETEARAAVVGLPLDLEDKENLTTRQARNFALSLTRRTDVPIYLQKEGLTSVEAEGMLHEAGTWRRKKARDRDRGLVDQMAATVIVRDFLEALKTGRPARLDESEGT
ncbi:MAG: Holliday junction resolvase RuvX [Deltaproteobacteria bacterium]|nr:Holliday junction resolvase RuvX [Deltaproteobacteria bacterium]